MSGSLIYQGLQLMMFGMLTVFVFLTLLIFSTQLMSKIIQRFFPAGQITPAGAARATELIVDRRHLAAISAAIYQYRRRHKKHD